jgi:3-oxoacyl-[acyl-carrier-protein] synthase II
MKDEHQRIVITGVGLTAPNGNQLSEFRQNLLEKRSGVSAYDVRYFGKTLAGLCTFDPFKYQKRKEVRNGTRAGSIAIYCAQEAVRDAGLDLQKIDPSRVGVYIGITEHGNVETENEIYNISQFNYDVKYWSHHHNPRTVANNPAGMVSINMHLTGPHYCIGGACAAGNLGFIQGLQMLLLEEVDMALCGGVSESPGTFGIFASFRSEGALATHEDPTKASRPFDLNRNGIVVSEGGALYTLERLSAARKRGAKIYGELVGYAVNSDADDYILPNSKQQAVCIRKALEKAKLNPEDIDIVNSHATATKLGDIHEVHSLRDIFKDNPKVFINNTKSYIGHCMGAAGALELSGNLGSFEDKVVHPTINVDELDPECALQGLVLNEPRKVSKVDYILNNSFGMLGINSVVIVKRFTG